MIDDQLLVGIVLIAAGVAIGLLAYALVLNRREAARPAEPGEEASSGSELAGELPSVEEGELVAETEPGEAEAQAAAPAVALQAEAEVESAEVSAPAEEEPQVVEVPAETTARSEVTPEPSKGEQRPIATLMRDDRTGKLALMIGDRQYTDPAELKGTQDWAKIERAAQDLTKWISEAQPPEAEPAARTKKGSPQIKSLVDEVNEILERKLAESGLTHRGVRLSQDQHGSVRVYIGIQGYTMEDIPDADIREVIRQAVAEWESRG